MLELRNAVGIAEDPVELVQVPVDDIQRALKSLSADVPLQPIEVVEDRRDPAGNLQELGGEVLATSPRSQ